MAVTALTITERRENVVDFAVPFMYYAKEMLLMKKESARIDLLQFADPFHENVWYTLLACIVIISGAVFVLNYFSPYGYKDENGRGTSWEFSFPNSVWFSLSCMLQQGEDKTPKSLSGGGPKLACHKVLCSPSWKLSQMSVTSCDKKNVKKFWLILLLKLELCFSVLVSVQCCKALILLDGHANSYRGRGRCNPMCASVFNNYSSSPTGLWVNSPWGRRPNWLLTKRLWGRKE